MILSLVNQKGGVGKTTTAVSLTAALTQKGKRVLLCDFDPQANATSGLGVEKSTGRPTVYDVIINGTDPKAAIVHTKYGDLLPSGADLAGAGIELVSLPRREFRLKDALSPLREDYDYILIDCPPSLELLTLNAQRPHGDTAGRQTDLSAEYRHLRSGADHVRRPHQSEHSGGPGGPPPLPRKSVHHCDPPERPAQRGAQSRAAHHCI